MYWWQKHRNTTAVLPYSNYSRKNWIVDWWWWWQKYKNITTHQVLPVMLPVIVSSRLVPSAISVTPLTRVRKFATQLASDWAVREINRSLAKVQKQQQTSKNTQVMMYRSWIHLVVYKFKMRSRSWIHLVV